ncbi:hypothetical protein EV360DRAFT_71421 [Lentinula raphanica]|nr:hypothetical protein EV360DRAFT_71421 [Lentinula raphanica]
MFKIIRILVLYVLTLLLQVAGIPSTVPEVVGDFNSLDGLSESDIIDALDLGLVKNFSALITLESVLTNTMTFDFTAQNTLILEMSLDTVSCLAGVNNTVFASFSQTLNPAVVIPTLGTADSGPIDNVEMDLGILATLSIIPLEELDIMDMNITGNPSDRPATFNIVVRSLASIGGFGGIPLAFNGLMQSDVPTQYVDCGNTLSLSRLTAAAPGSAKAMGEEYFHDLQVVAFVSTKIV